MKGLIACEFSQRVTKAFRDRGIETYSCDILPTEGNPAWHIQDDVLKHLNDGWDFMIAHPPCTYLAQSGLHYLKTKTERHAQLLEAFNFVKLLWGSPIEHIAIENPGGYLNSHWFAPSQKIQPYYFGEPELKTTYLWLKNLPILFVTKYLEKPKPWGSCIRKSGDNAGKKYNYYWRQSKTGHERSITFPGIANAMATQWGDYLLSVVSQGGLA